MNVLTKSQLAFRAGARAFRNGRQDQHNPYEVGTNEFHKWLQGFYFEVNRVVSSQPVGGA
jgi:hypothetical protein